MQNWLSILQEFPVPEPAVTVSGGDVPPLESLPRVILFDVYGTLVCPHLGDLDDQARLASSEQPLNASTLPKMWVSTGTGGFLRQLLQSTRN